MKIERTVLCLASRAMAQLAVQWLLSAELVLDFTTVASGVVAGFEVFIGLVHLVWWAELPIVQSFRALLLNLVGIHGGSESPGG